MDFSILKKRFSGTWPALVLITLIIYSNIYHSPFVFDDTSSIVEKTKIRNVTNYLFFEQLLKPRAIVNLTFALNYKFGRLNVFGYHLVNLLIHVLNVFLVYFLALTLFKELSKLFDSSNFPKIEHSSLSTPKTFDY